MSQVQFSGSCAQDSGSESRKSEVPGTQFRGPGCQRPSSRVLGVRVLCFRDPESQGSGSQGSRVLDPGSHGPRVPGLRVPAPRSRILTLDHVLFLHES